MPSNDLLIPEPQNIETFRGDAEPLKLTVRDEDNELVPLTDWKIEFTAKESMADPEPLFTRKNTAAGGGDTQIKIVSTGVAEIYIVPGNTDDVDTSTKKDYRYRCRVTSPAPDSLPTTVRWGKLTIYADENLPSA